MEYGVMFKISQSMNKAVDDLIETPTYMKMVETEKITNRFICFVVADFLNPGSISKPFYFLIIKLNLK